MQCNDWLLQIQIDTIILCNVPFDWYEEFNYPHNVQEMISSHYINVHYIGTCLINYISYILVISLKW